MDQYPTLNRDRRSTATPSRPPWRRFPSWAPWRPRFILGAHWLVPAARRGGVAWCVLFLMKSFVELVRVISDMLLPK
jgi:hypothetical protein